jgi:hypothetical protein
MWRSLKNERLKSILKARPCRREKCQNSASSIEGGPPAGAGKPDAILGHASVYHSRTEKANPSCRETGKK